VTEQATLFGDAPAPPPELHPRQQLVMDALKAAGHEGIRADEAGAHIHARRGKHGLDQRCDWCAREGREVLRRLKELGKARLDRHGNWRAADAPGPQDGSYDPSTAPIPF
jgi:hypothetical protein